jgi:tRNA(Ile)-lysidine synthase TilS/MesJ
MQKILSQMRQCIGDYDMIQPGDKIAVGVSGGKDSLVLLAALARLQKFSPIPFTVEGITIDLGVPGMDYAPIRTFCEELGVPYTVVRTDINYIVFQGKKEKNPCSLCSKMRRGALNAALSQRGIGKLALGHHYDDAVETFFLSLFYEGRLSCFQPVTHYEESGVTQIRPLLYCKEGMIRGCARRLNLPIVENNCPADGNSKRQEIKLLVKELEGKYPGLKTRVFGSMQRLPLPEWGIEKNQSNR